MNGSPAPENRRDLSADLLRLLACLMVVGIHTSMEGWYSISPRSYTWAVLNFYDTLCRPAVPLFVMISGSLFLRKEKLDIRRLWTRNIPRLLAVYILWAVFYAVMNNGIHKSMEDPSLIWNEISGPNPQYHLWYLRMIINIYAIAPILRMLVRKLDGKYFRYFFTLFFFFGILRSTVYELPFLPQWIHEQINLFVEMDLVRYSAYFILGYYLSDPERDFRVSGKKVFAVYLLTLVLAAGLTQWISAADNWPTQALYGNFALPVAVEAVCLFILIRQKASKMSVSGKAEKILAAVSGSTLFVYLIHPFVIRRMQIYFHLYTTDYNVLFSVPLAVLLVFILSSACGIVLKKIPLLNRLI